MNRRNFLMTIPGGLAVTQVKAQKQAPAPKFPGVSYREYSRCLPDYLRDLAARAYQKREAELAKLTSVDAIRARQSWVRESFWKLVGGMPDRTPLNARTVGSFERQDYRVDKVVYESRPGLLIPGNLYIPTKQRPPFPGILFQMGHSDNGKADANYQRCCQGLAKFGFLVLAFDPMGQGERVYYPGSGGTHTRLRSSDDEHTVPGKQMLLYGDTSSRFQVWDAIRSLDYLASHPMVDPKRLGSTGHSGGGTLTMLLSCVDDRLAAAVECMGITENIAGPNFNPPGSTDDAEQNFIDSGPIGFDRWDLVYPLAPKPLLLTVSDGDFFATYSSEYISNGWSEFQKLKKVYEIFGAADHLGWQDTPLPHDLAYDSRLQVYNWFSRWLKGEKSPIETEPPTEPEPDKNLWVSEAGNMVRSLNSLTPFTLNRDRKVQRQSADLASLLGAEKPVPGTRFTLLRRVPSLHIDIEAVEVASAPKVWLPAYLYLPRSANRNEPVLLVLENYGRSLRGREGGMHQALAAKGCMVCAADVRGSGDLWPEYGRGASGYARSHNDEENYAWASLILGRSLLGQRVTDILALAAALRSHTAAAGRRLVLAASGRFTVPALFAAALDDKIDRLYLAGGLISFRSVAEAETYSHPFGNFVPKLLLHTDLPEVTASISPRAVTLAGATGPDGSTLSVESVRKIYGSNAGLSIIADAKWTLDTLLQL